MSDAFGSRSFSLLLPDEPSPPEIEMAYVYDRVARLASGAGPELYIAAPERTAAFSRRDRLRPGYAEAEGVANRSGYLPIVRPVGGHLALYDEGSLVLHMSAPHPAPGLTVQARFEEFSEVVAAGLRAVGVDARVGPVPGEYCDGAFSINHCGRAKLVGTGQRITRAGYLFSAVVMVREEGPVRQTLVDAYAALGLEFEPDTVGYLAEAWRSVTLDEVRRYLINCLSDIIAMDACAGHHVHGRADHALDASPRARRRCRDSI